MSDASQAKSADRLQLEIFRRMTPQQRLECCFRWTNFTYEVARGAIRGQHPDWTAEKVDREIGRRISGIDVETLRQGPSPCRGAG